MLRSVIQSVILLIPQQRKMRTSPHFASDLQEKNGRRSRTSLSLFEFLTAVYLFVFLLPDSKGIGLLQKGQGRHCAFAPFVNLHNKISTPND